MITDDEVMRVLEQANPASVDDPIPMLDVAGYRDVLHAKSTTVTLIDSQPTPTEPTGARRWPIPIAAAAVTLVLVAALIVSGRRDTQENQFAAPPPVANGLIAFDGESRNSPSGSEIYVSAPDGTGLRALTSTLELDEYAPAWSPDGSRLAFIRIPGSTDLVDRRLPCGGCQLVVVDPSTGVETFSTDLPSASSLEEGRPPAVSVVWSPDGEQIMVTDRRCGVGGCGGPHHDVVDLQSGAWTTITPFSPVAEWSPDGRWLLLGPLEGGVVGDSLLIVPADLVGTGGVLDISDSLPGARRLSPDAEEDENSDAGWMPDSSALVHSVEQGEGDWNPRIEVIPIADGERRTVIEDGFGPVVSPDGSQIAFMRGGPDGSQAVIWVAAADGSDPRRVTTSLTPPTWSPDGSQIAFMRGRPDGSQAVIWVAAADGSDPRRVTTSLTPPTWSPDGSLLLAMDEQGWFTVLPDGTGRTMLPSIARTEPLRALGGFWTPSWQPLP